MTDRLIHVPGHEPHNRRSRRSGCAKSFAARREIIDSVNTQNDSPNQWRQNKKLAGGGCLPDVGLYCLNTTRFLLGEEPTEVSAMIYSTPGDPRFKEVEESVIFQIALPRRCAVHQRRRATARTKIGAIASAPKQAGSGSIPLFLTKTSPWKLPTRKA